MDLLQALAEPRRRTMVGIVWDAEREAGQIHRAIGEITFGAVSQHLRVLREAGAVRVRRDGRRRLYRANRALLRPLLPHLQKVWAGALANLKRLAEEEEKKR